MCSSEVIDVIESRITEINNAFFKIDSSLVYFKETQLKLRKDTGSEGAFVNNIDFFYTLFYERSDVFSDTLLQKVELYKLDYNKVRDTREQVRVLRTYKSHSLSKNSSHDRKVIESAERWYYTHTGKKTLSEESVLICSEAIESEVLKTLDILLECINRILTDTRFSEIQQEFIVINGEYCPDYYLEGLFCDVLNQVGIAADSHKLVKKYGSQFREKVKLFHNMSLQECEEKIKLRMEEIIFGERIEYCPLSAKRIMEEFHLEPGEILGKYKKQALEMSYENPYITEQEILDKLKEMNA